MLQPKKETPHTETESNLHTTSDKFHQDNQIKWKHLNFTKFFALNMGFNFLVEGATYPLDVIRTRMQVQGSSMIQTTYPKYSNSFDCCYQIAKQEGIRGLFKGFVAAEVGYVASHVVYYSVYEVAKQKLQERYPSEALYGANTNVFVTTAVAGALADLACCAVSVPSEIAASRLQIQGPLSQAKYASGMDVLAQIYRVDGLRGWYRGFGSTLIRSVPGSGIWWGTYEYAKSKLHTVDLRQHLPFLPMRGDRLLEDRAVEDEDPIIHIIAGALAGIAMTVIMNPIDVAKTRLQCMENFNTPSSLPPPLTPPTHTSHAPSLTKSLSSYLHKSVSLVKSLFTGHNTVSMLVSMVREEGVRALGKGMFPALVVSTPYSVLTIVIYEKVKKWAISDSEKK